MFAQLRGRTAVATSSGANCRGPPEHPAMNVKVFVDLLKKSFYEWSEDKAPASARRLLTTAFFPSAF
jgi:hypothetical protein